MLRALTGDAGSAAPAGAILYGDDITPTRFLATDWSQGGGIALKAGSSASHVAMLARARGVPMVVGLGAAANGLPATALLDAEHGAHRVRPVRRRARAFRHGLARPSPRAATAAGDFLGRPP